MLAKAFDFIGTKRQWADPELWSKTHPTVS